MKKLMAGIDLHSNNLFCGIVDSGGKQVYLEKLPNDLKAVIAALKPYKARLEKVAVESTFNWYWLVDGLVDAGFSTVLANPAQMHQYSGIKRTNDKSDALFLAESLRLDILPTAHVCDRELRPIRDMLRRRLLIVRQRTGQILSLKGLYARTTGERLALDKLKRLKPEEAGSVYGGVVNQELAQVQLQLVEEMNQAIRQLEKRVLSTARECPGWAKLLEVPGIGKILAMTIVLETADVERFPTAGDFASYCRCVDTERLSNEKRKGRNNGKCGNKYLSWAFVEAAHGAARFNLAARAFYDRKSAQRNSIVAIKALACKLAKACWHIMKKGASFDEEKMFGQKPKGEKSLKEEAKALKAGKGSAIRKGAEPQRSAADSAPHPLRCAVPSVRRRHRCLASDSREAGPKA